MARVNSNLRGPSSVNAAAGESFGGDFGFPLPTFEQSAGDSQVPAFFAGSKESWNKIFKPESLKKKSSGVMISATALSGGLPVLAVGSGKIVGYIGNGYDGNGEGAVFSENGPEDGLGNYGPILKLSTPYKRNGKTYKYVFYGACRKWKDMTGQSVMKGDRIAETTESGVFVGFLVEGAENPRLGLTAANPQMILDLLSNANSQSGSLDPDGDSQSGGSTSNPLDNPGSIATAAAFSSFFQMAGLMETVEAVSLTGRRSLLNDKPLLAFVEQIAAASLRSFMSMPNGNFYAFYPDYFGGLGRTAYWVINDIEIISGKIDLSDDSLATHVFVVGDTLPSQSAGSLGFGNVDWIDRINTAGVVNIFNAFMADFLNGLPDDGNPRIANSARPSLADKDAAINFLKKYGARPYTEEVPAVRSPIYETFLAYQRFCLLWASQFKTTFEFTFMPELFPGGLVELGGHGIQCYVEQVVHSGSYESGFTTMATLSAPAAVKDNNGKPVDSDRAWVHSGMIRAFQMDPNTPPAHPSQAYDASTPRPAPKKKGN